MKLKIIAWITFIMSFSWYFVLRTKIPQKYSNSPKGFQFPKFVVFAVKYSKVGHPGTKRSGVGVCLALRTLVREVKRTLAIVGSWIGPLSIKYGFDSRAPQQK